MQAKARHPPWYCSLCAGGTASSRAGCGCMGGGAAGSLPRGSPSCAVSSPSELGDTQPLEESLGGEGWLSSPASPGGSS
jgi:hypothetical protein